MTKKTSIKGKGPKTTPPSPPPKSRQRRRPRTDARWWTLEQGAVHESLVALVKRIRVANAPRRERLEVWRQLYTDDPIGDAVPGAYRAAMRTRYNLIRSAVDTVHSKIAANYPRPWVLTIDGDFELSNRAENQTKWLDGDIERLNLAELGSDAYLDALIVGTGAMFVGDSTYGRTTAEIADIADLDVDPSEERHNCVRSLYRTRFVDRGVLLEEFPDAEDEIWDAEEVLDPRGSTKASEASDMVVAYEAWRLPDSPDSPGRHVIAVDTGVLLDEPWTDECFPFSFVHWTKKPKSFWGAGIPEIGCGAQAELNEIAQVVSESYHLFVPSVWAAKGSINIHKLLNDVGRVYEYDGQMPTVQSGASAANDFAMREEVLIQRFFNLLGISQLSASSMKPSGLNSGKALTVYQDVESERFAVASRGYERFSITIAKLQLAAAERILARPGASKKKLRVFGGRDGLESVEFDAGLGGDKAPYTIRVFPVSALSKSAAAKIDEVQALVNGKFIPDPQDALELLGFPDLDRYKSVESAGRKLVKKSVEACLKGQRVPANPYAPREYAIRYASLAHDLATLRGAPEETLANLRDYIQMTIDLQPPPPAAPMAPPIGAMPPGGPMPPMPPGPLSVVPPM